MTRFLDTSKMRAFPTEAFTERTPFPWFNFSQLLMPESFEALYREFPPLKMFEAHVGLKRVNGQRPHDRYYLAYEQSIYNHSSHGKQGEVQHDSLPAPWRDFLEELKSDTEYQEFIERLLGVSGLITRYAWHVGVATSEVSPHRDADNKIGTHIFYFNTSGDWEDSWGGATLVLGGKKVAAQNPDFGDFTSEIASAIRDNQSFLFKNTPDAWHGVRTLICPEGHYRRLFNVIFQSPEDASQNTKSGITQQIRRIFHK